MKRAFCGDCRRTVKVVDKYGRDEAFDEGEFCAVCGLPLKSPLDLEGEDRTVYKDEDERERQEKDSESRRSDLLGGCN